MGDIGVENAELIGLWFQLLATGMYLVYFSRCMVLFQHGDRGRASYIWLAVVCILMFLCTISDQVLALIRTYQAFAVHGGQRPNPSAFFANPATRLSLAKNSFNVILTLLSDIVMVFRTYVIWSGNVALICLPVILMLANLAFGVLTLTALGSAKPGDDLILATVSVRFKYYLILTFCLNIFCAGCICWKIWWVRSRVTRIIPSASHHVVDIIMQSAGVYCAHLFALIVTNAVGTNVFFILLDPLPPMAAIIFSMMIVRARDQTTSSVTDNAVGMTTLRLWESHGRSTRSPVAIGVNIDLERVVHIDRANSPVVPVGPHALESGSSESDKPRSIS